ncbi:MAG: hypothetical protein M3P85_14165 [Actinomycetota bacterium]|nr:hypothetical protein [Actinomycetota bacterium]
MLTTTILRASTFPALSVAKKLIVVEPSAVTGIWTDAPVTTVDAAA